jgi:hypothetical protein
MVAWNMNRRHYWAITALNLFLGWTLVGWVVALCWALIRPKEVSPQGENSFSGATLVAETPNTPFPGCVEPDFITHTQIPAAVHYNRDTDTFTGTMFLMVKLAMRAVQELGWTLDQANETLGLVTFQTGISWGSWNGVSCSLNIEEVSPNTFRISGTGKQNVRGGQILALNIGGEAQKKALKAIDQMKHLAV